MKIERTNNDVLKYRVTVDNKVILTNKKDEKEIKALIEEIESRKEN